MRVNKNHHVKGISVQESRERHIAKISRFESEVRAMAEKLKAQNSSKSKTSRKRRRLGGPPSRALGYAFDDPLPYSSPSQHHHISDTERSYDDLVAFANPDSDEVDMALEVRFRSIVSCFISPFIPGLHLRPS